VQPNATHEICQGVQLCAHQATLSPPSCNHSVEEVKQHAKRHECQSDPQVACLVGGTEAVAHGELDRHDAAEAVHEGDEVGEVVGADQAEVAWVLGLEEVGLLVLGWGLLGMGFIGFDIRDISHRAAGPLLWRPFRRHWARRIV
jgi:hypothetical protein